MTKASLGIELYEGNEMTKRVFGSSLLEGFTEGFDRDKQRRVVIEEDNGEMYYTLPLNGWRTRNLEKVAGDLVLGSTAIIDIQALINLPGFDGFASDMLDEFSKDTSLVMVRVVMVEPSYGCHIVVYRL